MDVFFLCSFFLFLRQHTLKPQDHSPCPHVREYAGGDLHREGFHLFHGMRVVDHELVTTVSRADVEVIAPGRILGEVRVPTHRDGLDDLQGLLVNILPLTRVGLQ